VIDHIHLANHQNELHAKALPVLRFGWLEPRVKPNIVDWTLDSLWIQVSNVVARTQVKGWTTTTTRDGRFY